MRGSEKVMLHKAELDAILRAAKEQGYSRFRIFGSIARGTDTGQSDLDLLCCKEGGSRIEDYALTAKLEQLLGMQVDLIRENNLSFPMTYVLEECVPYQFGVSGKLVEIPCRNFFNDRQRCEEDCPVRGIGRALPMNNEQLFKTAFNLLRLQDSADWVLQRLQGNPPKDFEDHKTAYALLYAVQRAARFCRRLMKDYPVLREEFAFKWEEFSRLHDLTFLLETVDSAEKLFTVCDTDIRELNTVAGAIQRKYPGLQEAIAVIRELSERKDADAGLLARLIDGINRHYQDVRVRGETGGRNGQGGQRQEAGK